MLQGRRKRRSLCHPSHRRSGTGRPSSRATGWPNHRHLSSSPIAPCSAVSIGPQAPGRSPSSSSPGSAEYRRCRRGKQQPRVVAVGNRTQLLSNEAPLRTKEWTLAALVCAVARSFRSVHVLPVSSRPDAERNDGLPGGAPPDSTGPTVLTRRWERHRWALLGRELLAADVDPAAANTSAPSPSTRGP